MVCALLLAATIATAPDAGSPQKANLEVSCHPSSDVLIDGKVVGHTRFPLVMHVAVDPGKHRFQCRGVDGRQTREEEITVAPGETKVLDRRLPRD